LQIAVASAESVLRSQQTVEIWVEVGSLTDAAGLSHPELKKGVFSGR
jgi:hypothetical protein